MDTFKLLITNLVFAAIILVVGIFIAKKIRSLLNMQMLKREFDPILQSFFSGIAYASMVTVVVIAALGCLGVETLSLVAVLGAAGLAIGMALQGSLSNFASGVMLVIFRPFEVGDFIEAGGSSGVVEELQIFSTMLKTGDNKIVILPNSAVLGGSIVNYSANKMRRVDMVFGIGYGDDLKQAKKILETLVQDDERIMSDPAPTIAVGELADSSVNFVVRPWVKTEDYWAVKFDFTEKVKLTFDAKGISIPYPQQDVYMHEVKAG